MIKFLGFTASGLLDQALNAAIQGKEKEWFKELRENMAKKMEEINVEKAKRTVWNCEKCGSSAFEELEPMGDMRVIRCRRCKNRNIFTDGEWRHLTYVEPEGLEAWKK